MEGIAEIIRVVEPDTQGDLGNGERGRCEQLFGFGYFQNIEVVRNGISRFFFKDMPHIRGGIMAGRGNLFQ